MTKVKDETGKRYGRLVVRERVFGYGDDKRTYWLCDCDCGNQTIVRGESLRHGSSRSCGCLRKEWGSTVGKGSWGKQRMDETGKRFGRLLVLRKGESLGKFSVWICKCDCGNIVEVRGSSLRSGNTQSCGCYQRERQKEGLAEWRSRV